MNLRIARGLALLLLATTLTQCRKDASGRTFNTSLTDIPLASVQEATKGRWELRRISGGLCAACDHPVTQGSYMILSTDYVVFGNDSLGVVEQGPIGWAPASYFGGGYVFTTPSGNGYVPTEIRNDTLLLQQYAADGLTLYFNRP
ncbi:hypothetical protein [Flaviaesturariibacter terrae]